MTAYTLLKINKTDLKLVKITGLNVCFNVTVLRARRRYSQPLYIALAGFGCRCETKLRPTIVNITESSFNRTLELSLQDVEELVRKQMGGQLSFFSYLEN